MAIRNRWAGYLGLLLVTAAFILSACAGRAAERQPEAGSELPEITVYDSPT